MPVPCIRQDMHTYETRIPVDDWSWPVRATYTVHGNRVLIHGIDIRTPLDDSPWRDAEGQMGMEFAVALREALETDADDLIVWATYPQSVVKEDAA